jgi:hypothetical protein
MNEVGFGLPEISRLGWGSVMPKMNMLTPKGFQQLIIGPGVVCGSNAFTGVVGAIATIPELVGASQEQQSSCGWYEESR